MRSATADLNYRAVQELFAVYGTMAEPGPALWSEWLDRAETCALEGRRDVARLAVDFARKANVEPWGGLGAGDYDRMRAIEAL